MLGVSKTIRFVLAFRSVDAIMYEAGNKHGNVNLEVCINGGVTPREELSLKFYPLQWRRYT